MPKKSMTVPEFIKIVMAQLEGKQIQEFDTEFERWVDIKKNHEFDDDTLYRVKEEKPDDKSYACLLVEHLNTRTLGIALAQDGDEENLILIFDKDGKLIDAEVKS